MNNNLLDVLIDKSAICQVLGGVLLNNELLLDEKYKLEPDDFFVQYTKICFSAIKNLSTSGLEKITPIDVDIYLKEYPVQYNIFNSNGCTGIEFLQRCMTFCEEDNFEYYYNIVRKYSLLRKYHKAGFDVTEIINPLEENTKLKEKQVKNFSDLTIDDIINHFDKKMVLIKEEFNSSKDEDGGSAADGLKALYNKLTDEPEIGLGLHGGFLNAVVRGARLKKFYLRSGASGTGKTRMAAADASSIGIGTYYNVFEKRWIVQNEPQSTLFITTELEVEEIQTLVLAFVSGVDEAKILDGNCDDEEKKRIAIAIDLIEKGKLDIVQMSNFDLKDVENKIRKYKYTKDTQYLFFDYIHVSLKLLAQISSQVKGMSMREDSVLYMFSVMLKDLCNELNIFCFTSTQLNRSYETKEELNETSLRGAMSIADKLDAGMIAVRPTNEELETVAGLGEGFEIPNHVMHCFKVRRSRLAHLKIWSVIDLGTCQIKNLFITDYNYALIDVKPLDIRQKIESQEDLFDLIDDKHFTEQILS